MHRNWAGAADCPDSRTGGVTVKLRQALLHTPGQPAQSQRHDKRKDHGGDDRLHGADRQQGRHQRPPVSDAAGKKPRGAAGTGSATSSITPSCSTDTPAGPTARRTTPGARVSPTRQARAGAPPTGSRPPPCPSEPEISPAAAPRTRTAAPPNQRATGAVSCSGAAPVSSTGGKSRAAGANSTAAHTPAPRANA